MKWFQHDCAARLDPRIRTLGKRVRAEGMGIFWGLLEEIGRDSETFHLKVRDYSPDADARFDDLKRTSAASPPDAATPAFDLEEIPQLSIRILAADLFTTPGRLRTTIDAALDVGLFDRATWQAYNILYSAGFARRADNYHRRQGRRPETVRPVYGGCADTLHTVSEKLHPEQNTTREEKKNTQTELPVVHAMHTRYSPADVGEDAPGECRGDYDLYHRAFRRVIATWNQTAAKPLSWMPSDQELERLFLGGDPRHRVTLCLEASRKSGKDIHYADLVLRALRDLLKAHQAGTITNPFGWIWTCLHGTRDGGRAWIVPQVEAAKAPP